MKIRNMNNWLPRRYYTAWLDEVHLGNFTTEQEAQQAYQAAKQEQDNEDKK